MGVPDEELLAAVLHAELTDVLPPKSRVLPWRRGADFFAMRVLPADRSAELVLRVPLREIADSAYDGTVDFGDLVEREALVHEILDSHRVPVAPLLGWGRASEPGTHSWMLFRRVDRDEQTRLSASAHRSLGTALRRIHEIPYEVGLAAIIGTETSPTSMVQRIDTRVRAFAERTGRADLLNVIEPATAVITGRAEAIIQGDLRLTHMDLRAENLCFRGDDLIAVLDLSNSAYGDPVAELGRMAAYGMLTDDLLAGYGSATLDEGLVTAYAVDTFALLGLLGTDELADQVLVDRGLRGIDACIRRLIG